MEGIASSSMPVSVISVKPSLQGVTESWEESTKEVSTGRVYSTASTFMGREKAEITINTTIRIERCFFMFVPSFEIFV